MIEKKKSKNRRVIALNYYQNGAPFDFNLELHKIEASIENYKASMELAEKHNYDTASAGEEFLSLLSDLHTINGILKGRFDIVVIFEKDHDGHIDCSDIDMSSRTEGND